MTLEVPATPAPSPLPGPTPRLSPLARTVKVFTDPARAWEGLREKSAWGFPLLLGLLVFVVLQTATFDSVTVPTMQEQWNEAVANGRMEAAQADQMSQFFTSSPWARWIILGPQLVFWTGFLFLQALIVWFGVGFLLGARMRYGAAMDVVCWSGLVKIPQLILFYALALVRQSITDVHLGLGLLVPEGDAPTKLQRGLTGFLDLIGPFEAWWLFVAIVGAAALSGAPRKKVAWVVVALYLALGAFFTAAGAFFGPGM